MANHPGATALSVQTHKTIAGAATTYSSGGGAAARLCGVSHV